MVIDAATWRVLGRRGDGFERHPAVAIRGRRRVEDVYSLRLDGAPMHAAAAEKPHDRPA
jgi:hypothetical protein